MIAPSFKFKMALLSVSISGLILGAFAFLVLTAIEKFGLDRVDRELRTLGDVHVRTPRPNFFWAEFDGALSSIYGDQNTNPFLLKINDSHARTLYVSPHWPAIVSEKDLGEPPSQGEARPQDFAPRFQRESFKPPGPPGHETPLGKMFMPPFLFANPASMPLPMPQMRTKPARFVTVSGGGHTWRFAVMGNEFITLMLGQDLAAFQEGIQRFRNLFLVATPLALLLLAAGGWWLAGQALRPVKVLTRVAAGITAKGLDQRVRIAGADREFRALIDVINSMLIRLETSFQQAARFSADAAHELKTPLTILQGQLEQALQEAAASSPEQCAYAGLLEEVERLKVIVRKLLLLSQADSGQLKLSLQLTNLSEEIQAVYDDARSLADGLILKTELAPGILVMADPILLRQALQNLAANALKHNRPEGRAEFTLRADDTQAVFTLANTVDTHVTIDRDRIFTRFYRADKARGRTVEGAGLGLSLAREIAIAHQGDLVLRRLDENLIEFMLVLPLAK
ncbi:MAG: ATP-binding protein [Lentisphaerota bacterium]